MKFVLFEVMPEEIDGVSVAVGDREVNLRMDMEAARGLFDVLEYAQHMGAAEKLLVLFERVGIAEHVFHYRMRERNA